MEGTLNHHTGQMVDFNIYTVILEEIVKYWDINVCVCVSC